MLDEESIVVRKQDDNGINQLHYGKINATDDELQQVTHFIRNADNFRIVKSTKTLYFIMPTTDPVKRDDGATFMFYNLSRPRTGSGFVHPTNEVKHIFTAKYSFENGNMTLSNSTDVFEKVDKPFNVEAYSIDVNETWIAFTAPGNNMNFKSADEFNSELFVVPTNLTQQPVKISDTITGKTIVDIFDITPSGNHIMWAIIDKSNTNFITKLNSYDTNARKTTTYLKDFDHFISGFNSLNDEFFLFSAFDSQTSKVYSCDMATGKVTARTGDDVSAVLVQPMSDRSQMILKVSNITSPPVLSILDFKTWETNPLEKINAKFMSQFEMNTASRFSFPGWNNEVVTGWLSKPAGFDPSKKYPAVVMNHGGPNGDEWTNAWYENNAWTQALYPAHGYFVIAINHHGSAGHGKNFTESIYGQWGGNAYEDTIKGLDYALQQNPQIDPKRVCAMGASYGGYMTNWLSVKSPERFACFITHAGLFDLTMSYLTMGTQTVYNDYQFRQPGSDFHSVADFSKYSPSKYVKNWAKPMLISHGGKDVNVPTDQGLAAFTALQYSNITSKFLLFPTEAHIVADPPNIIVQINTYLDWLNNYTKV